MVEVIKKNFRHLWIGVLSLAAVVVAGRLAFNPGSSVKPSLQDVLATQTARPTLDSNLILAFLLTVSFAALSAVKGYEIFRRNQSVAGAMLAEPPIEENDGEKELEELRISRMKAELDNLRHLEVVLRKNSQALNREIKRLKSENEALTLKTNPVKLVRKRSKKRK